MWFFRVVFLPLVATLLKEFISQRLQIVIPKDTPKQALSKPHYQVMYHITQLKIYLYNRIPKGYANLDNIITQYEYYLFYLCHYLFIQIYLQAYLEGISTIYFTTSSEGAAVVRLQEPELLQPYFLISLMLQIYCKYLKPL